FGQTGPMRDVAMFGFYIFNNIGIDFQIFGSGLVLGVGPVFSLLFNGVHGGAVMAHLTNVGHVATFYGFVSGHSSFELIGAALSGAAGLRLGLGLIHPGRRRRLEALKDAGRKGARLLIGAALLTFIAAGFEGFWSANQVVPWKVKVALGLGFWLMLLAYFAFAGRTGEGE
ncbi:MAG TPA: stage II sporulation protein M, partial [Holophagaceae bacterium]|nr:stage II sporulation protein M [Holophagaceae bacterium]